MRLLLLSLLLFTAAARANFVQDGVSVQIDIKGATDRKLTIEPSDQVIVVFRFTNESKKSQKVSIYEFHPYHNRLPVLAGCAVRFLDANGELNPTAKINGEWWTQYICWSTTFPEDRRNIHKMRPGETIVVEARLHEILRVPAGGHGCPVKGVRGFRNAMLVAG